MYCYKCGKYTESDETLCPECKAQQNQAQPQVVVVEETALTPAEVGVKAPSNKHGVTSMVLSLVAAVFLGIAMVGAMEYLLGLLLFSSAALLTLCIISLTQGIKAIKQFIYAGKTNQKRPIPGFVMGLIGLETVAVDLLYWLVIVASYGTY